MLEALSKSVLLFLIAPILVELQHTEIFDGSQEADSNPCVLNNFFDVREE